MGQMFSRQRCVFLRVCGQYMEEDDSVCLFACPQKQCVVVAEWGPLFTRTVIQPGFFSSFLLQCKVPPTLLCITAVSDSQSHHLLGHLHPNTSVPALYAHFLELWQSAQ